MVYLYRGFLLAEPIILLLPSNSDGGNGLDETVVQYRLAAVKLAHEAGFNWWIWKWSTIHRLKISAKVDSLMKSTQVYMDMPTLPLDSARLFVSMK